MVDRIKQLPRPAIVLLVLALVVGLFLLLRGEGEKKTVVAYFSRAVAIYEASEVRILGVEVGEVVSVVPDGNAIKVTMEYDAEYKVPAKANAAILTPTLTSDRFIQLSPAYTGGAELADGAEIPLADTGTPIELDRIYKSLSDLTKALGPNGVNKNGTLNNVLVKGARFLDGNGARANQTIRDLSQAISTFADGRSDLFGTVKSLNAFTTLLAENDAAVNSFMQNLGAVSEQLGNEKDELITALANLAGILGKVKGFVKDNRGLLVKNLDQLATTMKVIASKRDQLTQVLDIGPLAMGNLVTAFDPITGSVGSRLYTGANVARFDQILCAMVERSGIPASGAACDLFEQLLAGGIQPPAPRGTANNAPTAGRVSPEGQPGTPTLIAEPVMAKSMREMMGGQ